MAKADVKVDVAMEVALEANLTYTAIVYKMKLHDENTQALDALKA